MGDVARTADGQRVPAMKRLVATGALLLGGTLLAVALGEGFVRLLGLAPEVAFIEAGRFRLSPNPRIGFEPVPGLDYHGDDLQFFDYHGRSNSLGFRDREHPAVKPSGVFRIIVLGDSIAQGLKVAETGSIFPFVLEKQLGERGIRAEVLNFGVSGYNTLQEVEIFKERGLAFHPDLVVVAYCLNDTRGPEAAILNTLLERERGERQNGGRSLSAARLNPCLARSALYRFVRYRILSLRDDPTPDNVLLRNTVAEAFRDLALVAERERFRVLVAVFPYFERLDDYPYEERHEAVRMLAAADGFEYLDLLPAFRRCAGERQDPLAFDIMHPTRYGHMCAASALGERIAALAD